MKKYNSFINENNDEFEFKWTLIKLKMNDLKNWIYDYKGLDMNKIIYDIFIENDYHAKQSELIEEKKKFDKDIKVLNLTGFPGWLIYKKEHLSNNMKIVKTNQNGEFKWHPVSKLNTNYYDLSDLIIYVIREMSKDENIKISEIGKNLYNGILNNPKSTLLEFKPRLKKAIEYYLIEKSKQPPVNGKKGLGDFIVFTKNILINSSKGEHAEKLTERYLTLNNFDIPFIGGDGDFIDMIYGVDMIVYREDFGYKSVQIKTYEPQKEYLDRYKTDWFIIYKDGYPKIIDLQTKEEIRL